jgi:coniferyl-aldehyde dehydrogenase
VVLGEADIGVAFSRLRFDHLLFTGATSIGKHVMRAAAENLTPLTLELGGKSPAIVSHDVPLKDAAERIAFGKTLNAGQTCVAPDYVLVPKTASALSSKPIARRFAVFIRPWPTTRTTPRSSTSANWPDSMAISATPPARRAADTAVRTGPGPAHGPQPAAERQRRHDGDAGRNLRPAAADRAVQDLDQAFAYINQRPRPLALYYFGYDKREQNRVLHETHSGGVCLNDTLLHVAQDDMPFGGIGPRAWATTTATKVS